MPLYVRDEEVNRLVEQARKALGAPTKTEAVRIALERVLREERGSSPLQNRLKALQERTLALGMSDPDFDEKRFTDALWGR